MVVVLNLVTPILLVYFATIVNGQKACPGNCTCGAPKSYDQFRGRRPDEVIDCSNKGYFEIPYWDIPCDTRVIDFSDNKLIRLTRSSFRGLQQLEYIYLARNQIDYMEAATFAGLPNLKEIVLSGNNFDDIDERPFWDGTFPSLMVQFDQNPFFCDIELKRTIQDVEYKIAMEGGIKCADGERRRPVMYRNRQSQVKGFPYIEAYEIIRNRHYSWEIGLIAGACWTFTWLCVALFYFFWT